MNLYRVINSGRVAFVSAITAMRAIDLARSIIGPRPGLWRAECAGDDYYMEVTL